MKKPVLMLCLILTAAGCTDFAPNKTDLQAADNNHTCLQTADSSRTDQQPAQARLLAQNSGKQQTPKRMFIYQKKLYIDTGEISTAGRCGVMDGTITKSVSAGKTPTKELQSNFGKGYDFQLGTRSNRLEVCIDDTWHIFAYNENNLDGVSVKVRQSTASSAILIIKNKTDREVCFGDSFFLEKKDYKTGEWHTVQSGSGDPAFHDIAYVVKKGTPVKWKADWRFIYGALKPGTYRIVKEFRNFRENGKSDPYTLSAKFRVEAPAAPSSGK